MSVYYLPVVISDSDYPIQSSTSTLTIRVCSCDATGNMRSCSVDALLLSAGLSTGALVAILLCILILLSEFMFTICLDAITIISMMPQICFYNPCHINL